MTNGSQQAPVGIRELAEAAKRNGAFDLAQGVIDASPPASLLAAMQNIPLEDVSTYNNKRGVPEYRRAVQNYLNSRGWTVELGQIMNTAGAMGATTAALLTHARPGDTILLPEPFFVYHKLLLETIGFKISFLPAPLDNHPDWNKLEREMKKSQALILTTPANPTGQVASAETMQWLSEIAAKTGCLLLIDEMYREFIWGEKTPDDTPYADLDFTNTIIMRSFSKTFAIPGWRVAFAVTSPERIERLAVRHDALYIGGSTIAQFAMAAALEKNLPELNQYVVDLRQKLLANKQLLTEAFTAYGMQPLPVPATYYMIIKHNRSSDMATLEELMAKKIVVTPLQILYADPTKDTGYIRIHFGVSPVTARKVSNILTS